MSVARVVVESALPQLGGEFDYVIPETLGEQVEIGCRVSVPIGRTKKLVTGFVTDLMLESEFARRELSQVLGPPMLAADVLDCCRTAAKRQVVTVGELLRLAIPAYMPKQLIPEGYPEISPLPPFNWRGRSAPDGYLDGNGVFLASPTPAVVEGKMLFDWATLLLSAAYSHLERGESALLVVPELDDFEPLLAAAQLHGISALLVPLDDKRSAARYQSFWLAKRGAARIYLGTRSAVLHPAKNLGLIGIFDDLDESLRPKASPYLHAREFALIRAQASEARVIVTAHYRSLEAQRLVSIGFAKELSNAFRPPRLSHYESQNQLPTEFFTLVRSSLEQGSVLVLVPNRSWSVLGRCKGCEAALSCSDCGGPGYMPSAETVECRLCSSRILACSRCGSRDFKQGRAGATRISAELGRAFPGTVVRDFSGSANRSKVGARDIVVATPSAAPRLNNGYSGVAVVDCAAWLNRSSLRSEQYAIRDWQEAIALLSPNGRAALFGVPANFGRVLALQDFINQAAKQLKEMLELRFPPAWRVCRLTGDSQLLVDAGNMTVQVGAEVLTRTNRDQISQQAELLLRFRYQDGVKVSTVLAELAMRSSLKGAAAGRRRLKIAMDDLGDL